MPSGVHSCGVRGVRVSDSGDYLSVIEVLTLSKRAVWYASKTPEPSLLRHTAGVTALSGRPITSPAAVHLVRLLQPSEDSGWTAGGVEPFPRVGEVGPAPRSPTVLGADQLAQCDELAPVAAAHG